MPAASSQRAAGDVAESALMVLIAAWGGVKQIHGRVHVIDLRGFWQSMVPAAGTSGCGPAVAWTMLGPIHAG